MAEMRLSCGDRRAAAHPHTIPLPTAQRRTFQWEGWAQNRQAAKAKPKGGGGHSPSGTPRCARKGLRLRGGFVEPLCSPAHAPAHPACRPIPEEIKRLFWQGRTVKKRERGYFCEG